MAFQRSGFIFDENGAVVESEAIVASEAPAAMEEEAPQVKQIKRMVFDKPFVIVIKRKGYENPYFVMTVNNPELMIKK